MRANRMMQIRAWAEPLENLWPEMRAQRQALDTFFLDGNQGDFGVAIDHASTQIDYSWFAWRMGEKEEADRILQDATQRLSTLVKENPENRLRRRLLASALYEYWMRHGLLPSDEAAKMLDGYLVDPEQVTSCDDATLAAKLEVMRGNNSLAKNYTLYVLGKGFYEPGFVAFCKRNDLCEM